VLKPSAVVELVWQDASGSTSATTIHAPSSATVIEIDASASALASILMPLTGCVLIKQRIRYIWVPDEPVVASGGTSVLHTGSFFFATEDDNPIALIVVRAIKDEVLVDSGPTAGYAIDTDNTDVIAFENAVIDGMVTNVFGNDAIELITAYLQSRV